MTSGPRGFVGKSLRADEAQVWEKGQKIGFFTLQFRIYRAVTSSLALCDLLKLRLPRHPPPPFPEPLSKGGDGGLGDIGAG